MADVAPVVHAFKVNLCHGLVGASQRLGERVCRGGNAQHAAAGGEHLPVLERRAGVEDLHAGNLGRGSQAGDGQAGFVAARIAGGAGHDAGRRAGRPAQRRLGEAAVDAGFERVDQVAIEANQDGLGFRIAEAGVEFEHLRPARGHHEAAVEHAGEGRIFLGHACDGGLGNVAQNPLRHGGIEQRIGGVDAHAAGVGAGVALADALVVLRGNERRHVLAVAEAEEADLVAFEEFFDDDLLLGLAQQRAGEKALRGFGGGMARGADDDAFACEQAVGLDDDGRMKDLDGLLDFRGVVQTA